MFNISLQELEIIISERSDGSFREANGVEEFLKQQHFASGHIHLQLENQAEVVVARTDKPNLQVCSADAILSHYSLDEAKAKTVSFSMLVGDCFPLIIFDQKSKNMAMVHAGRGPLYLGVLEKTWQELVQLWRAEADQLWVYLGPGIRRESYLLPQQPEQMKDSHWQKFIQQTTRAEQKLWQIDLPAMIKAFFQEKALPSKQFIDSQLDTYAQPKQFFSHRRRQELLAQGKSTIAQAEYGRMIVACRLKTASG